MTDFDDTLRLMREQAQVYGFAVYQPEMTPGEVVLIDMNALELDLKVDRFTVLEREDRWDHKVGYEMRYSLGIDFGPGSVQERDPFWEKPPQDFHGAVRWIKRVVGYDWRRLRGKLRRYPKSIGVLTGLSA